MDASMTSSRVQSRDCGFLSPVLLETKKEWLPTFQLGKPGTQGLNPSVCPGRDLSDRPLAHTGSVPRSSAGAHY